MALQLGDDISLPLSAGGSVAVRFGGVQYDLLEPGGSDRFIEDFVEQFFFLILERVEAAREDNAGETERTVLVGERDAIYQNYQIISVVASHASLEVFDRIPVTDMQLLLNEMKTLFAGVVANPEYVESGQLTMAEEKLLKALCSSVEHYKFAELLVNDHIMLRSNADESSLLAILADLLTTGPHNYKSSEVGKLMIIFARNMVCLFHRVWEMNPTEAFPVPNNIALFRLLDECGIFADLLKHMANPSAHDEAGRFLLCLLEDDDSEFVRDVLKVGTPSGNVVRRMNATRAAHERLRGFFETLETKAMELNNQNPHDVKQAHCRLCSATKEDKNLEKLLRCARCKGVWYCSRDCQKLHWKKQHNDECQPV